MYKRISFVLAVVLALNLFGMESSAIAVIVPDVVGMEENAARSAIFSAGLVVGTTSLEYSDTVPYNHIISQDPVGGTMVQLGTSVDLVKSRGIQTVPIPDVVGMTQAEAESTITSVGLVVGTISYEFSSTVPNGHVISQDPPGGHLRVCRIGSTIDLVICQKVEVPDVVGLPQSDAESVITAAGLVVGTISYQYSDSVLENHVISQNPAAGTSVPASSSVDLNISFGPVPMVEVPDVVGMSESEADSAITSVGLYVSYSYEHSDTIQEGHVIDQYPSGGTSVPEGSDVDLTISSGSQRPGDDSPIPAQPVVGSLIAHWKLDETSGAIAYDSIGDYHCILMDGAGGPPTFKLGINGQAIGFYGDGDHVLNEAFGSRINGLDALTIALWVKSELTNADKGFIIFEDPVGNDDRGMRYDALGANGGGVNLIKIGISSDNSNNNGRQQLESSSNVQTNEWQHLAMTWRSGEQLKLYINGQLDTPTSNEPGLIGFLAGNTKLIIGKGGKDVGDASWQGLIDDVRIYNCALSADNILSLLYSEPIECLVAHWKLDETSGAIAYDSTGNHDGILCGNPIWQPTGGKLDGALLFDGFHNYYVDCGTFNPSEVTGQLSICLWAKWNGLTGQWQGLIGKRDSWNANDMMWQLEANMYNGSLGFFHEGSQIYHSEPALPLGEWAHIAVTFDGITRTFYHDGEPTSSGPFSFGSDTEAALVFGCCEGGGGGPFNGALDDIRIYDCALDKNQIKALMSAPPSPPSLNPLSDALDTSLSFTTGGNADWFDQRTTYFYDGDAAQSGDIKSDRESWMQTTVSGKGTVSFFWKVSSEYLFDLLEFYIDGSLQDKISGSVDWCQMTYQITVSDLHILEWRYVKDMGTDSGSDCGWVDKVTWMPAP